MTVLATESVAGRLLAVIREDSGRADIKASVLLTVVLAVPAFLVGSDRLPHQRSTVGLTLLILSGIAWSFGATSLVRAVLPRSRTARTEPGITFYADVVRLHNDVGTAGVAAELARASEDSTGWLITQAIDMSHILASKYRCIRWAVGGLISGLACGIAGLLLG
ncbi:Pycsar system effector family protein [Streptomyces sp. NPDC019890]|uniref:Pycsar system effector family protein n=1 Tax=Streptomyces sp. NPDC019890 TaxID=3365064 RepID=UPI00384B7E6D